MSFGDTCPCFLGVNEGTPDFTAAKDCLAVPETWCFCKDGGCSKHLPSYRKWELTGEGCVVGVPICRTDEKGENR